MNVSQLMTAARQDLGVDRRKITMKPDLDSIRGMVVHSALSLISESGHVLKHGPLPEFMNDAIGDGPGAPELVLSVEINDESASVWRHEGRTWLGYSWDDDHSMGGEIL